MVGTAQAALNNADPHLVWKRMKKVALNHLAKGGHRADTNTLEKQFDQGLGKILDSWTAELNKFIAELKEMRQAPSKGVRRLNLLYGAQVTTRPPRFRFTVNDPGLVTRDYAYWVENQLRERFNLEGVPVVVDFRERS